MYRERLWEGELGAKRRYAGWHSISHDASVGILWVKRKTGGIKERAKVRFGSFATADYQHKQVHETGGAVGGIHYIFDEKEGAVRTDGRASVAGDSGSIVVRPIVKDPF